MNVEVFFVVAVSVMAAVVYVQRRFSKQHWAKLRVNGKSKQQSAPQRSAATHPEQASHNLECSDQLQQWVTNSPPIRDGLDADFAAEAHGFTGFESVGKGSCYKSSESV